MPPWYHDCPECGGEVETEKGMAGPSGHEIFFECDDCDWTWGGIYS